jgi:Na+/melibiose symporter-like transporter
MLLFLCIAFCADLAMGVSGAMFFLLFDSYLGLGASFSLIFITSIAVSTVSLKLWEIVVKRTSKTRLLTICLAGGAIWGLSIALLRPGPYTLPAFMVFLAAYYVFSAGRDVALYATIGDVVDFDSLKTGSDRAGLFSSGWMVLRKLAYAIGPAIGFFVAGMVGYDPSAEQNDALGIFGLKSANGYLPALLLVIAFLLALRFPITPEKHRIIRRRLEQRHARAVGG